SDCSFRTATRRLRVFDRGEEDVGRGAHRIYERSAVVLVEPAGDGAVRQRTEGARNCARVEGGVEITVRLPALHELQQPRVGLVVCSLRDETLVEPELDACDLSEHAAKEASLRLDPEGHLLE